MIYTASDKNSYQYPTVVAVMVWWYDGDSSSGVGDDDRKDSSLTQEWK